MFMIIACTTTNQNVIITQKYVNIILVNVRFNIWNEYIQAKSVMDLP